MLSKEDIEWMKETRVEVVHNRQRPIKITYTTDSVRDPITGVTKPGASVERTVISVVTDRTSRVAAEKRIREQAEVIEADIWFSISIDQLTDIDTDKIEYAFHNDVKYKVVANDPKGIGEYNRYEFVGKRVT